MNNLPSAVKTIIVMTGLGIKLLYHIKNRIRFVYFRMLYEVMFCVFVIWKCRDKSEGIVSDTEQLLFFRSKCDLGGIKIETTS
jgi:hypothetical protein